MEPHPPARGTIDELQMKRQTGGSIGIYGGINGVASMDQDANNERCPDQMANLEKHQRQRVKRLKMNPSSSSTSKLELGLVSWRWSLLVSAFRENGKV